MGMTCPQCGAPIALDDINIKEGVAVCRACQRVVRAASLVDDVVIPARQLVIPSGAWDTTDGQERCIGATTRSAMAIFLVPFTLVWAGGSLGGIYGGQLYEGTFELLPSLFGVPFILGSVLLIAATAMMVAGRVEIRLRAEDGAIFTGVGPFGFTRRFKLSEFSRIIEAVTQGRRSNSHVIALEGARRITFGSMLNSERRYFVIESLRPLVETGNS